MVSCSPDKPQICYATQDGFELLILLSLPLEFWGCRYAPVILALCGGRDLDSLARSSSNWITSSAIWNQILNDEESPMLMVFKAASGGSCRRWHRSHTGCRFNNPSQPMELVTDNGKTSWALLTPDLSFSSLKVHQCLFFSETAMEGIFCLPRSPCRHAERLYRAAETPSGFSWFLCGFHLFSDSLLTSWGECLKSG